MHFVDLQAAHRSTLGGVSRMKMAKHSKFDTRGKAWIACSECARGGNGDQSCSAGWKVKRGGNNGCCVGSLHDGLAMKGQ